MKSYVNMKKVSGVVPGVPDGTGPYGRGMGPGGGRADGSGLQNGPKTNVNKKKVPGVPDGTGPGKDSPACPYNTDSADYAKGYEDGLAAGKSKKED